VTQSMVEIFCNGCATHGVYGAMFDPLGLYGKFLQYPTASRERGLCMVVMAS
jgi:hypothetical protein